MTDPRSERRSPDPAPGGSSNSVPGTETGASASEPTPASTTSSPAAQRGASSGGSTSLATEQQTTRVPQQAGAYREQGGREETPPGADVYGERGPLAKAASLSWGALLFGGVCMIAAGIVLLAWPHATLLVVAILVGLALIVSGVIKLYEGFTAHGESGGMRAAYVVIGLLAVLAGLYCLRHHALSILLIAFVTGVYFIMHGIADIGVAISARVPGRWVRALLGVFSLFAGVIMIAWPALTLVLLLTIVAAWLILYGLMLAFMAFSLRRALKSARRVSTAAPTAVTA